jgi:hypothetical protein
MISPDYWIDYFRATTSSTYTSDRSAKMVAFQGLLYVLNLKGFKEKLIESHQRQGIVNVETVSKRGHKIDTLLKGTDICRGFSNPKFYLFLFRVESDLKLQLFHNWLEQFLPCFFERSQSVWRNGN